MNKLVVINACSNCPSWLKVNGDLGMCLLENDDCIATRIPDWCPLPDAKTSEQLIKELGF